MKNRMCEGAGGWGLPITLTWREVKGLSLAGDKVYRLWFLPAKPQLSSQRGN